MLLKLQIKQIIRKNGIFYFQKRIYSVAIASNRSAKRSCQMPGARCQGRYLSNCHLKDETECLQTGTIIIISFHFTYRRYVKYRPWSLATGNWLLNSYPKTCNILKRQKRKQLPLAISVTVLLSIPTCDNFLRKQ